MRVAIYSSVLYGADFMAESLESILPFVDEAYVVMMQKPWGNTTGVTYKGEWVSWPAVFDGTRDIVKRYSPRARIVESQKDTPWNRWGHGYDVVSSLCKPDEVLLLDPDCVFAESEARKTFGDWEAHPEYVWASPPQVELWRTPAWQVTRPRSMVSLHRGNLALLSRSTEANRPKSHPLKGHVHNFGFCVSEQAMLWKHLTAMAFSPVVGESLPNPAWYDKWLTWTPEVRDLDVSLGGESGIPCALPYDTSQLPMSIQKRYAVHKRYAAWK